MGDPPPRNSAARLLRRSLRHHRRAGVPALGCCRRQARTAVGGVCRAFAHRRKPCTRRRRRSRAHEQLSRRAAAWSDVCEPIGGMGRIVASRGRPRSAASAGAP